MKKIILLWFILSISWLNLISQQESFLENALIATPAGYQKILQNFEDKICTIQIAIGLFVNEIIDRKNETVIAYNRCTKQNKNPILQQASLSDHLSYDIATQNFHNLKIRMMMHLVIMKNLLNILITLL